MKPILFKTEMVQAILAGNKTQTRRVIKHFGNLYHYDTLLCDWALSDKPKHIGGVNWEWTLQTAVDDNSTFKFKCPYGKIGDVLWVRETWRGIDQETGGFRYEYKATEKINLIDKWKPSIYMPREAARLFLEITDVRVERLQDISDEDVMKEVISLPNYAEQAIKDVHYPDPDEIYSILWDKINGKKYPWSSNPWVWVIDFKRIDKPNE